MDKILLTEELSLAFETIRRMQAEREHHLKLIDIMERITIVQDKQIKALETQLKFTESLIDLATGRGESNER